MDNQSIEPDKELAPFVKNIFVFNCQDETAQTNLPFFADGFPGILYQNAKNSFVVYPHNKNMPSIFIYGQTIQPIEIQIKGAFTVIIFQLYPFVLKSLFDVTPDTITDNCYQIPEFEKSINKEIQKDNKNTSELINDISAQFLSSVKERKLRFDSIIKQAVEKIIFSRGQVNLNCIASELNINKRTFERRFLAETALQPKQFAKIIQFQSSLIQMSVKDYNRLTDVVYENGYADQSHFIRVFKSFTGKTPGVFVKK